ncbi:hypothetical protein M8C21_017392 [Ambrosia artemisiifolia]|uniref:Uncharacterized protein n=1 Tax=Ambrosia artemisiifolia TaxID=4212 RepID=A0AAD5CWW0_AMBAR|nr:hypothetical protein M8C21_017392 [Ambrosia artemisiifolia]
MGARLTTFENRANVDMEIRVFVPPDRPDRYRMIVRLKPGEIRKVLTRSLFKYDTGETDNHIFLMIHVEGVYTGVTLLPWEVKKYAKIIGYYRGDSGVNLKGVRFTFSNLFRLE